MGFESDSERPVECGGTEAFKSDPLGKSFQGRMHSVSSKCVSGNNRIGVEGATRTHVSCACRSPSMISPQLVNK